jgi:hypothetical protein
MNRHVHPVVVCGLLLLTLAAVSAPVLGQTPLPPVGSFVSNLDVRCYKIDRPIQLFLDHLNPLFIQKNLPREFVDLDPQQLCVPVYKNGWVPPPDTLPFIRYVDWRCYGINGPPLNLPLRLTHLNPVISSMYPVPFLDVTVREPQQLCVPVAKIDPQTGQAAIPPPDIQRLVQWLDVKCYRIDAPLQAGTVWLNHLNPLLVGNPPDPENVTFRDPFQLCVPVAKTNTVGQSAFPPPDVLPIIQNSDVLCYRLPGQPLNRSLRLVHLNPLLANQPADVVRVTDSQKFCVPVAKSDPPPPPPPPTTTGDGTANR